MADLTQTRTDLAAAVQAVDPATLRIRPSSTVKHPRPNDGWVIVERIAVGQTYLRFNVTFTVVILLTADEVKAEQRFATLATQLVTAVTAGALHASEVAAEPVIVLVGETTPAPMYAIALTLTLEVD